MDKSQASLGRALNLSLAIYRLTDKLPKGEVLVGQIRKLANEVVGDLVTENFEKIQIRIELLLIYFKIGQAQNWVREINWLVLENEYRRLGQEVELYGQIGEQRQEKNLKKQPESQNIVSHNNERPIKNKRPFSAHLTFSPRQKKIIEELKLQNMLKMADLSRLFGNSTSDRTIRNDLHDLISKNLIDKSGARKTTVYFLK